MRPGTEESDCGLSAMPATSANTVSWKRYDRVDCDEHPIGTNAVVAVITYTGQAEVLLQISCSGLHEYLVLDE